MGLSTERLAVFRSDASTEIGAGHVVRCLALAEQLCAAGFSCHFAVSKQTLRTVPIRGPSTVSFFELACDRDGEPAILAEHWPQGTDLLILDHYGLDGGYARACRPWARRILVVDDLADRPHDCDFLLDQTLDRSSADYRDLVPDHCRLLLGPRYALLRPQFAAAREKALARRGVSEEIRRILISFGTYDPHNVTSLALRAIGTCGLDVDIDVVLGSAAPHWEEVRAVASALTQRTEMHCDVSDMAQLMLEADMTIGGAGSSIWERMCLGLPSICVVLASNQEFAARAVSAHDAAAVLWNVVGSDTAAELSAALLGLTGSISRWRKMSDVGFSLVDGRGAQRVARLVSQKELLASGDQP